MRIPKFLIAIPVVAVVAIGAVIVVPYVLKMQTDNSPIKEIRATNNKVYAQGNKISATDFTVIALHDNGKESTISSSDYKISTDTPAITGETTTVEIVLNDDDKMKCSVAVENKREAIVRYKVGSPNLDDVKATLYSNGELCFEGEGDVLQFRNFPWIEYEDSEHPITSITFEEGVEPTIMDDWFAGIDTLTYVGTIPSSVQSMNGTFADCTALKEGADWSKCETLNNIEDIYNGCTELTFVPAVPESVVVATNMCYGCSELKEAADLTKAKALTTADGMFQNCTKMVSASMAPKVITMTSMYGDCINLKEMPTLPNTVKDISDAFDGCKSLQQATTIPASVEMMDGTFQGCANLTGSIVIDANADSYSSLFNGACVATQLEVSGKSENLKNIVFDAQNEHITLKSSKK